MSRAPSSMRTPSRSVSRASSISAASPAMRSSSSLRSTSSLRSPSSLFRGTILVSVRAKPDAGPDSQWVLDEDFNSMSHPQTGSFTFDCVHGPTTSNAHVFDASVKEIIYKVAEGYNGTVFAYGMTGSGKTFSMQGTRQSPGVIPQSVNLLFQLLATSQPIIKVSYMEIYNERVCDLLSADQSAELTLRDDPVRGVKVVGLREIQVYNAHDLHQQIQLGDQLRRTSSTQFNLHSSRSHAVVQISVQCMGRHSYLYLCDLAGSERAVNELQRRKEGAYINKSLLTLGSVISRLSTGGGGHVPFRDSKLTRLLQPSLQGNALVSVLCTVHASPKSQTETLSTLRFAARAKNIVVAAHKNVEESPQSSAQVEQLRAEIAALRLENDQLKVARDDLQGQLDMYMRLEDENADESLESVLSTPTSRPSTTDSKEQERLQEQISDLIHKLAKAQHDLLRARQLTHPDVAVQDLLDEISELKETIADKNQVINYLRGSSERRIAMNTLASPSSKSRMSFAPVPFPH